MAKTPDETPIGNVDGDVDKYENLMLTPNGSIVAMIGDKELKPETDQDWEARQAERRARETSMERRGRRNRQVRVSEIPGVPRQISFLHFPSDGGKLLIYFLRIFQCCSHNQRCSME